MDKKIISYEITSEAKMRPQHVKSPIYEGERIAIGGRIERKATAEVSGKVWREATHEEYLHLAQAGRFRDCLIPIRETEVKKPISGTQKTETKE